MAGLGTAICNHHMLGIWMYVGQINTHTVSGLVSQTLGHMHVKFITYRLWRQKCYTIYNCLLPIYYPVVIVPALELCLRLSTKISN